MQSPLKTPHSRLPGQSLTDKIKEISENQVDKLVLALLFWTVAIVDWIGYLVSVKRHPLIFTVLALIVSWIVYRDIRKTMKKRKDMQKGLVGEQILGKYLEEKLMPFKYHVIHDLIGKNIDKNFNIDHVVVGPTGIFCIETKNWTNPDGTHHQIFYDGKKILVDGFSPDRDPLTQVLAGAKWVEGLLETLTGKSFLVQPILVFLGSYTTKNPGHNPAWVLNEQGVPPFIKNNFRELSQDSIDFVVAQLKKYSEEQKGGN